MKQKITISESH